MARAPMPTSRSAFPPCSARLVERFQPRLAVIACNTASTIALDEVRAALDIPVVGTVPAIKPAAALSSTRVIAVLGTEATVRQPYVDDLAARFAADCTVIRHGSPELVGLAEAKLAGEPVDPVAIAAAVAPMLAQPPRRATSTPSCSPAPIFRCSPTSSPLALPGVALVDGGPGIARRIAYLTAGQPWPSTAPAGIAVFTGARHPQRSPPRSPASASPPSPRSNCESFAMAFVASPAIMGPRGLPRHLQGGDRSAAR